MLDISFQSYQQLRRMDSETSDVSAYSHHQSLLVQPLITILMKYFTTPQGHYVAVLTLVYFYSNSVTCNVLIKFIVTLTFRIDRAMDRETGAILSDHIKQGCMTFLLKVEVIYA